MCEYINKNNCGITKTACPYMYFCNKTMTWKESKSMPKECNIKSQVVEIPNGYYPIIFEKKGNLYININGVIEIIKNPFKDNIPKYVKIYKNKQGNWIIKK